tara:strand:- start:152 stop:268 length:117 start_codon:yes stop_codon:yes gene_type:complete
MQEYKSRQLFNRENSVDSIHENVAASEVFINDKEAVVI